MRAKTLTMDPVDADGWQETAGVLATLEEPEAAGYGDVLAGAAGAAGSALGGPYGGLVQGAGRVLGGLIDGKPQSGATLGAALGGLAGGALGTVLGGPAGTALGGAAGTMIGKLAGGAADSAQRKPAHKNKRKEARARATAKTAARLSKLEAAQPKPPTPTAAPKTEAPPKPAAVSSKSDTPSAVVTHIRIPPPASTSTASTPASSTPAAAAPEYPPNVRDFRATLTAEQGARLDQAIRDKRGAQVLQDIVSERAAMEAMDAELARQQRDREQREREQREQDQAQREREQRDLARREQELAERERGQRERAQREQDLAEREREAAGADTAQGEPAADYDDAAAPPAPRPRPRVHIGLIPLKQHQLEAFLVNVPTLRKLDTRLLRSMTGRGSTVRDTAGIDPATRRYCAEPGETALGIAKKLTGREERAADLLAANPSHRDGTPWNIPPGWMHFAAADTGEVGEANETSGTTRAYIIQAGDTPVSIATKSGAKAVRPGWWAELKAANPQIPTKDDGGNFERFFAGQQLWIPDPWPASPMFQVAPGAPQTAPSMPTIPGSPPAGPAPANTTMDPGVPLHTQAMLAYWAQANRGAVTPADYGMTLSDHTGTTTTRFTSALASFQAWRNARNPASKLRTDGVLDGATYQALHAETAGAIPVPGPGAVPWAQPSPQTPQGMPQTVPGPLGGLLGGLLGGILGAGAPGGGVPGIGGGLPQLGGPGGYAPVPGQPPINVPQPTPPPGTLPPGAVPGFHVKGMPPNVVWTPNGSMITTPDWMKPLDAIYGTPPPDFVWQGGNETPGANNLPWVKPAQPFPPGLGNGPQLPWPWGQPAGSPQTAPPAAPQEAKKDSSAVLPILALLSTVALSS